MWSNRSTRRIALAAGAAALIGMGALSACSTETKDKPVETKSPTASSAPASAPQPTEKKVNRGANSFSPTVKAPAAPTALPGNVVTGGN